MIYLKISYKIIKKFNIWYFISNKHFYNLIDAIKISLRFIIYHRNKHKKYNYFMYYIWTTLGFLWEFLMDMKFLSRYIFKLHTKLTIVIMNKTTSFVQHRFHKSYDLSLLSNSKHPLSVYYLRRKVTMEIRLYFLHLCPNNFLKMYLKLFNSI